MAARGAVGVLAVLAVATARLALDGPYASGATGPPAARCAMQPCAAAAAARARGRAATPGRDRVRGVAR